MKKIIFFFSLLATLLIAGCNEQHLIDQLHGTWHVQKYTVNGVDKTHWFDTTYAGFQWNFSGSKDFYQTWNTITIYHLYTLDTITHLDTVTHTIVIDSVTTSVATVPTGSIAVIRGDWYLTNSNQFLETRDSTSSPKLYQIIDHSKSNLHLLYGNIDYYLAK